MRVSLLLIPIAISLFSCGGASPEGAPKQLASMSEASNTPRDGYGNPDFNGICQALGTAHWNLEAHAGTEGPVVAARDVC